MAPAAKNTSQTRRRVAVLGGN
ncbi:hypothetical protein, partial [Mycobacterium tuberculosis]